jgi:hypothetical protein
MSLLAGQVHCLSATTPEGIFDLRFSIYDLAGCRGAAPRSLSFGDSTAQAGAQPVDVNEVVRLPGIAPGLPRWRGGILLLNHNREIERAGSVVALPAHAISTKNKHLLVIYSIPTRGFTAALSVFRGTPPPKPLNCKAVSNRRDARLGFRWADPNGGTPRHSCA